MRFKTLLHFGSAVLCSGLLGLAGAACSSDPATNAVTPDGGVDPGAGVIKKPNKPPAAVDDTPDDNTTEPDPATAPTFDIAAKKIGEATFVPLGVVGDDVIVYDTTAKTLNAQPIDGTAAMKIADVAGAFETKPTVNFKVSGGAVAIWTEIVDNVGKLSIWTRADGLKEIASGTNASLFLATPTLSRILYLKDLTVDAQKSLTSASVVVQNPDGTKQAVLGGTYAVDFAAGTSCPPLLFFNGDNAWAQYCPGTSATATRARLVVIPPSGTVTRVDAAALDSAETIKGDTVFDFASKAFVVEISTLTTGGKGKLIDLGAEGFPSKLVEDNLRAGTVFTDSFLYITGDDTLKRNDLNLTGTAQTLATGVADVGLATNDGKWITYTSKAPLKTFLLDTSAATPAPVDLGLTNTLGTMLINAKATNLTYVSSNALKTRDLATGTVKDLAKPAFGMKSGPNGSLLVYTAQQKANTAGTTFFYSMSFLPDNATTGKALTLTGGTLSSQMYFKGTKAIFRRAYSAEQGGGIYTADLPVNPAP